MITGEIRSKIEGIWNACWSGGISNPLEVIEQITYLLFMRRLDECDRTGEHFGRICTAATVVVADRFTAHAGLGFDPPIAPVQGQERGNLLLLRHLQVVGHRAREDLQCRLLKVLLRASLTLSAGSRRRNGAPLARERYGVRDFTWSRAACTIALAQSGIDPRGASYVIDPASIASRRVGSGIVAPSATTSSLLS